MLYAVCSFIPLCVCCVCVLRACARVGDCCEPHHRPAAAGRRSRGSYSSGAGSTVRRGAQSAGALG